MAVIYLIRHGQASFDSANYDELSPLGHTQAAQLGAWFKARRIRLHGLFSGTMVRHRQTAKAFTKNYGIDLDPVEHEGLNEYDHEAILQAFVGQYTDPDVFDKEVMQNADPRRAFQLMFEKAMARWVEGQHNADYPESWPAFKARIMAGLGTVCAQAMQLKHASGKANVAVFTSGGPISVMVQQLLGIADPQAFALNWVITNCSVSKLLVSPQGPKLLSFNEQAHFEGEISGVLPEQAVGLEAYAAKPNGMLSYR